MIKEWTDEDAAAPNAPLLRVRFVYNLKKREIVFDRDIEAKVLHRMLQDIFRVDDEIVGVRCIEDGLVSPLNLVSLAPEMFCLPATYNLIVGALNENETDSEDEAKYYYKSAADSPSNEDWSRLIQNRENAWNYGGTDFKVETATKYTKSRGAKSSRHYAVSPKGGIYKVSNNGEIDASGKRIVDETGVGDDEGGEETFLQKLIADAPVFEYVHVDGFLEEFQPFLAKETLGREEFCSCFENVLDRSIKDLDPVLRHNGSTLANEIFSMFSNKKPGRERGVPTKEILSGVSFLCQGSSSNKIRAAFQIFCRSGHQRLSFEDFTMYLGAFMMLSFAIEPAKQTAFPRLNAKANESKFLSSEEVGHATARHCFRSHGKKYTDLLDISEFQDWFSAEPKREGLLTTELDRHK